MNPTNPTAPTNPGSAASRSAMSHGGTFMRPGAVAWGHPGRPGGRRPGPEAPLASASRPDLTPAAIEQALSAAVKDPERVTDLLDELSRGRLWLPLPDKERPVTDGSAVLLPTVTYLGAEFVPAFTSARQLVAWHGRAKPAGQIPVPAQHLPEDLSRRSPGDGPFASMPHIVVPAAELARRMPPGVGIALNPGAAASVPIYPEGVTYLAAAEWTAGDVRIRLGQPPTEPECLLREISAGLRPIRAVRYA